jgi:uncharacterized damage-inducible protein DinB
MAELAGTVNEGFAIYFDKVRVKMHKWVDPLTNEQFWTNPFPYGNDVGHLVLHLTGNLNHYIGAHVAGTKYVRDRDREFTEAARPPKEEALRRFDQAVAMVIKTIRKQSEDDWSADYGVQREVAENRFQIFLDCVAHADHHVGQIITLSRELRKTTGREKVETRKSKGKSDS